MDSFGDREGTLVSERFLGYIKDGFRSEDLCATFSLSSLTLRILRNCFKRRILDTCGHRCDQRIQFRPEPWLKTRSSKRDDAWEHRCLFKKAMLLARTNIYGAITRIRRRRIANRSRTAHVTGAEVLRNVWNSSHEHPRPAMMRNIKLLELYANECMYNPL